MKGCAFLIPRSVLGYELGGCCRLFGPVFKSQIHSVIKVATGRVITSSWLKIKALTSGSMLGMFALFCLAQSRNFRA